MTNIPRFHREIYITLNADTGKVNGWSSSSFAPGSEVKVVVPLDHDVMKEPYLFRYANGELTKVAAFEEEAAKLRQEQQNRPTDTQMVAAIVGADPKPQALEAAKQFNKAVLLFAQTLPEDKALEIREIYPAYEVGKDYAVGAIVKQGVNEKGEALIYKVLQAHKSQADWIPKATPALYKAISSTPTGVANWVQPVGAVDAYALNAIVMHKSRKWKSTAANNVWEPGVYGWVTIT